MADRSQAQIRRDIHRLLEVSSQHKDTHPPLRLIHPNIADIVVTVDRTWQAYQDASVHGTRERQERDDIIKVIKTWVQQWRPTILLLVPGAESNIKALPSGGGTPDDMIRVASDMKEFLLNHSQVSEALRTESLNALGDQLEAAIKENAEAVRALPAERKAQAAYSEAVDQANTLLVQGIRIVRAVFGPKSTEYKQFIRRRANKNGPGNGPGNNNDDDSNSDDDDE